MDDLREVIAPKRRLCLLQTHYQHVGVADMRLLCTKPPLLSLPWVSAS